MKCSFVLLPLLCSFTAWSQNERELADGKYTFRANCAFCHGVTGHGGRGPALVGRQLLHGSTDDDIKNVIHNGVPGTTMPAFETMDKDELNALVAYIRSLSGERAGPAIAVSGDPAKGHQVYQRNGCAGCHRVGFEGSVFGPDLTRIGAGRSAEYIRESLVNPSGDIPQDYSGVTVVSRDGKRVSGIRINEDTFSVQLRDLSQTFRMFQKDDVQQMIHETKSLMPSYAGMSKDDLQNLLAYLNNLRGDLHAGAAVKKAGGIR